MARYEVPLGGAGPYYLVMYTAQSGRTVYATLYWRRDAYGPSSFNSAAPWSINIAGVTVSGNTNFSAPGGGARGETYIGGAEQYIYFGSDVSVVGSFNTQVTPGSATIYGQEILPSLPNAPTMSVGSANPDQITTTSMRVRFSSQGEGGSPVTNWILQRATDAAFTQNVVSINSSGTSIVTGLNPDTGYYWRAAGVNAYGQGPWSGTVYGKTLVAVPPGMTVAPNLSGTGATVTLTPPGSLSSVTSYRVERRPIGGAATVYNSPTSPIVVTGLTPGQGYEWRASAFIGDYQTPWTDWVLVVQPQTNTNAGDYFDGSTPTKTDTSYSWLGTANNSMSRASGPGVLGWEIAGYTNGGTAVLHRITGGDSQVFGARMTVLTDATGAGIRAGVAAAAGSAADVAPGGVYRARMAVRPSRAQRGVLQITWLTAAFAVISNVTVSPETVLAAGVYTRLTGIATAPVNAEYAVPRFLDVAGASHSPWLSGEYLDMDSAFLTVGSELLDYFDGNTPDTAAYAYSWIDDENDSPSVRTTLDQSMTDPLADPDCPPIPRAPLPPVIDNSCIVETGSWRRYWAIIPESEVYDWLAVVPTLTIATGAVDARQVRIRFYSNPDALAPQDAMGLPIESEQIISYMPPNTVMTLDGVSEYAWASVNGGEELPADSLLYGSNGGPATWPLLSCGASYLISFDVPLDAPDSNLSVGVSLTTRML